jgi:hypothetical protein
MFIRYLSYKYILIDIASEKVVLKNWIDTITDPDIIEQIIKIKSHTKFDFEEEWAKSISITEARTKSKKMIASLPWKR